VVALVEAAIGLTAALGGVAVAATAGGAALAGLFIGGLLPLAEEIKQTSEDVETVFEGLSKIFESVGQQAVQALAPLRGVDGFQDLAIGALNGAVELLGLAAQTAANLSDVLGPVARRLGAVFERVSPRVFGEFERAVRSLAPLVEGLFVGTLRSVPGVIRSLTDAADDLAPDLRALGANLAEFLPDLVDFGVDVARLLLPPLNTLLDLTNELNDVVVPAFDTLVDTIEDLAAAFGLVGENADEAGDSIDAVKPDVPEVSDSNADTEDQRPFALSAKRVVANSLNPGSFSVPLRTAPPPESIEELPPPTVEQPQNNTEVTVENVTVPQDSSDRDVGRRVGREVEKALREKRRDQRGGTSG
jgi:hypothetical protein